MKECVFQGVGTALLTPLTEQGVDLEAFRKLIRFQLENGVDALVVAGTTGESAALSQTEFEALVVCALKEAGGRVPVIVGAGSNVTAHAIERTRLACELGADAILLVTPYYNKTTQRGLVESFRAIADASSRPCILYNVPPRTGLNMLPETVEALADHPRIAAVKEASGNISQVARIRRLCGDRVAIYSGCDDQTVPILSLGGKGLISVASNLVPRPVSEMCHLWFQGDTEGAARLQLSLLDLMNQLMSETNPIPVKAGGAALGLCENRLRLPLVPMSAEGEKKLLALLEEARKL